MWLYRQFNPSFNAVAKSWHSKAPADKKNTVFFATLDFADGREVFSKVSLRSINKVIFSLIGYVAWAVFGASPQCLVASERSS